MYPKSWWGFCMFVFVVVASGQVCTLYLRLNPAQNSKLQAHWKVAESQTLSDESGSCGVGFQEQWCSAGRYQSVIWQWQNMYTEMSRRRIVVFQCDNVLLMCQSSCSLSLQCSQAVICQIKRKKRILFLTGFYFQFVMKGGSIEWSSCHQAVLLQCIFSIYHF